MDISSLLVTLNEYLKSINTFPVGLLKIAREGRIFGCMVIYRISKVKYESDKMDDILKMQMTEYQVKLNGTARGFYVI